MHGKDNDKAKGLLMHGKDNDKTEGVHMQEEDNDKAKDLLMHEKDNDKQQDDRMFQLRQAGPLGQRLPSTKEKLPALSKAEISADDREQRRSRRRPSCSSS